MESSQIDKKIKDYEYFVNHTLKNDLKEIQHVLQNKTDMYKEWEEVKQAIEMVKEFKEKDRDMTISVELGCGVRVQGEITDYERSYVNIGLGYLLEMDCDEAEKYADVRLRGLQRDIDHYRELAVQVKVNIKMVLLGINELMKK